MITIGILILALWAMTLPITAVAYVRFDLLQNRGFVRISVLGVQIVRRELSLTKQPEEGGLVVEPNPKKKQTVSIEPKKKRLPIRALIAGVAPAVDIRRVELDIRMGKKDNAMASTFMLGGARILTQSVLSALKSFEPFTLRHAFVCEYTEDAAEAAGRGTVSVSVANALYAVIGVLRVMSNAQTKYDKEQSYERA